MRVRFAAVALAVVLLSMGAALHATSILNQPFNSGWTINSPGSLSNKPLTQTFNGFSISSGGSTNSTLQVSGPASGGNVTSNNVAYISLNHGTTSNVSPAEIWISFLFQDVNTQGTPINGQLGLLWLDGNHTGAHGTAPGIGSTVVNHSQEGHAQFTNATAQNGTSIASGQTYLFVAELTLNSAGTRYTQMNIWIDPKNLSSLSGSPDVTMTGSIAAPNIAYIGVKDTLGPGNTLYFGNVSVGTTYGDVLHNPEPSAFALTGIGLLGLLLLRRRAR